MRRFAAAFGAISLAALLAGSAASADAPSNDNNCAGVLASGLLPEFAATDAPAFGQARSEAGQAGTVDDAERAATEALASCGTP